MSGALLPGCGTTNGWPISDLIIGDAKDYRDALLARGLSPATINRALISLALFFDASGRAADTTFRQLDRVNLVEHAS